MSNLDTRLNQGSPITGTASSQHDATTLKICDEYDSDDADIELISSDNYRFKVHSYHLQSASSVFRRMIPVAYPTKQQDPIILTDEWMECSRVVKRVLDIIYHLEVGQIDEDTANTLLYALNFAKKWDITIIPWWLKRRIWEWMTSQRSLTFEMSLLSLKLQFSDLTTNGSMGPSTEQVPATGDHQDQHELTRINGAHGVNAPHNGRRESNLPFDVPRSPHGGGIFDLRTPPHQSVPRLSPMMVWIMLLAQDKADHYRSPIEYHVKEFIDAACDLLPPLQALG